MLYRILAVGDVVSRSGINCLSKNLRHLKQENAIDFTVINGENAAGVGLNVVDAQDLFSAGADVITLGNHTWDKARIADFLEDNNYIIRPANFAEHLPGRGWNIYETSDGVKICVINLLGRVSMDPNVDNPFTVANKIVKKIQGRADIILVDFHAEATSEKLALSWFLDGKVSAVWGTHTHVPTADTEILPKGTGHVTDLGMTGPINSVIGIQPQMSINKFLGGIPRRFESASGACKINAVMFTVDTDKKVCVSVKRVDFFDNKN